MVEVISRNASTREILRKLLYADDLAVVADSEADLQERLVDWKAHKFYSAFFILRFLITFKKA